MTSPAGSPQTLLSQAALTHLSNVADGVVGQSAAIKTSLYNNIHSEMMPGFKGDAANASLEVTNAAHAAMEANHRDIEAMSQQVKATRNVHAQNSTEHATQYKKVGNAIQAVVNRTA